MSESTRTGGPTRILLMLCAVFIPAIAQDPIVQLTNATRSSAADFQVGDRFEIVITGPPNQPISVRTTRLNRTDWSPIIGSTGESGVWETSGQFEKSDFGGWSEEWTVGGKLANPAVQFSVGAPCLKDGRIFMMQSGINMVLTCDTAEGRQTFSTMSDTDAFRTPDGRLIPSRVGSNMTAEQHHLEILESFIASRSNDPRPGRFGREVGDLILKMIGANALNDDETRNVLTIVRAAFENPDQIPQAAKDSSGTLILLRKLVDETGDESLKQQIAETMTFVQAGPMSGSGGHPPL